MNFFAGIVVGVLVTVGTWMLLTGTFGETLSRRLCGEDIFAVPCVLTGVVLTYLLPLLAGIIGALAVWLSKKRN